MDRQEQPVGRKARVLYVKLNLHILSIWRKPQLSLSQIGGGEDVGSFEEAKATSGCNCYLGRENGGQL